MSVTIHCRNLCKKYGEKVIIPDLSLDIKEGEFFTLLGPSGCGKTTLLRMIAGFNSIEGGTIHFDDEAMNEVLPKDRNIGMVFQNYAIFPNMSTFKNVAFGLENRKLAKDEISKRVDKILETVHISALRDSMPSNMSGGQQQRIALARAIVIEPRVLLMDEPLSNLDAKLRIEMRNAIKEIQKKVDITTVYVTHDQEEAMAVSDRIAVMHDGVIQHVGTPPHIYHRPANCFVASFIGSTNLVSGQLEGEGKDCVLTLAEQYKIPMPQLEAWPQAVKVSIRPEDFYPVEPGKAGLPAVVVDSIFLGVNTHYVVENPILGRVEMVQESALNAQIPVGTSVVLAVKEAKINVFDAKTEENITAGVINDA